MLSCIASAARAPKTDLYPTDPPLILECPLTQRASVAPRFLHAVVCALALWLVAGCSTVSVGSVESLRLALHGDTADATPASVAASPYFQLQVDASSGRAILILANTAHGVLGWYGVGHDIVFTRDGLVTRTVGLPQNLDTSVFPGADPFHEGLHRLHGTTRYTRRMDWSPGYRYGVVLDGQLVPGGLEDVTILDTVHRLRRVDETLVGQGVHLHNRYWVDPADGFIWKSRQYVAPDYPLELVQLRPYRESAP